ncbi:MAG: hypothetical protein JWQ32_1275 [Marmoricola sp.]|nr:hypothetical protein [Marmoricola sp.]
MIKKVLVTASFGTGYVLGARAGRERYEQIRRLVLRIKDDPHVRQALDDLAIPDGSGGAPDALSAEPVVPGQSTRIGQ